MDTSITKMVQRIKQILRDNVRLNIMVIGESGLGKTTFLQTLMDRYSKNEIASQKEKIKAIRDQTTEVTEVGKFKMVSTIGDIVVRKYCLVFWNLSLSPGSSCL
jgi:septin family protein